jgi:hypothetical protein
MGADGRPVADAIVYSFGHDKLELRLVESDRSAGVLMVRPSGTQTWKQRGLAPLEFQLLRTLCARSLDAAAQSPARRCVPTRELVRDLPFQSKYANEENVRQVVKRLRELLARVGVGGLVAVSPGRGYFLACDSITRE